MSRRLLVPALLSLTPALFLLARAGFTVEPGEAAPVPGPSASALRVEPAPARTVDPVEDYLEPIVSRNLFHSAPPTAKTAAVGDPSTPVESELPLKVISCAVASDPAWSTALVAITKEKKRQPRKVVMVGAEVLDSVVRDIERPYYGDDGKFHPARLVLERDGRLEFLEVDNPPPKKVVKKKKRKRKRKRTRRRRRSRRR